MAYLLLGVFLIIEGIKRLGYGFNGDNVVQGILLIGAGVFLVIEYL